MTLGVVMSVEVCHNCYGYRKVYSAAAMVTQLLDKQFSSAVSSHISINSGHHIECIDVPYSGKFSEV